MIKWSNEVDIDNKWSVWSNNEFDIDNKWPGDNEVDIDNMMIWSCDLMKDNEVDIDNKWSGDLMKLILITNDPVI